MIKKDFYSSHHKNGKNKRTFFEPFFTVQAICQILYVSAIKKIAQAPK